MRLMYTRKPSAVTAVMVIAEAITLLTYRLWPPLWLAYLWLRYRYDRTTNARLTPEDVYCQRYFADPAISGLLDEYVDFVCAGLASVLEGRIAADDALPPAYYELCARLEGTIAERVWQEDDKLDRTLIADRRWVWETARERASELTSRMFWGPPAIAFDGD
jgi:hypothetical protein